MPKLKANGFSIDFNDLNLQVIDGLPVVVKNAAQLIIDFRNGKQEFLLHTSGSTGKPKPIYLQRDKIIYSANLTAQAFDLKEGDTLLCCLGLNYVAGFMMVMRAVVLDCDLFITEPKSNPLTEIPENQHIDFVSFVSMQLQSIFEAGDIWISKLNKMKAVLLGGGDVSEDLKEKIKTLQVPVYQSYATTETYTHIALRKLNGEDTSDWYKALQGVELGIDDRNCLTIKSYITDHKKMLTNDVVELKDGMFFRWLGRFDNIINSGGIKIQPEEVEDFCRRAFSNLGLAELNLFAAGLPDEKLESKLVLIIESETFSGETENKIVNEMLDMGLEKYKLPKQFFYIRNLPKTHTGKIDKTAVLKSIF